MIFVSFIVGNDRNVHIRNGDGIGMKWIESFTSGKLWIIIIDGQKFLMAELTVNGEQWYENYWLNVRLVQFRWKVEELPMDISLSSKVLIDTLNDFVIMAIIHKIFGSSKNSLLAIILPAHFKRPYSIWIG